jgi:hypothetical protein
MTSAREQRIRQLRSRVLVRSWDYRQRRHARGIWFRLRRLLADASQAYAITRQDADLLVAEGHRVEPLGRELEPPKLILFAPAARLAGIASRRPLAVRLSADLMLADCLALVAFQDGADGSPPLA